MLEGIASRFIVLWGWRRLVVAFLAGALSALALPPFDLFPILFLTLPVFVWLMDGTVAARREGRMAAVFAAALVGWAFGFGYFLAGLWWIGSAFLVEADIFGWMMPFAVMALPAGLALFTAAGAAIARLLWTPGPRRIFAFAFGLTISELGRGYLFTGFPWNTFGYALTGVPIFMQMAALAGLYGLTILTFFIFSSPAALTGPGTGKARLLVPGLAAALLVAMGFYGAFRLADAGTVALTDTRLRIVQPSIDQSLKWQPDQRNAIFTRYLELSDSATSPESMGIADVDLLIWPESALPFVFDSEPEALPAIAALLPAGTTLATGMQRVESDDNEDDYRVYNSILLINDKGEIEDAYDKVRLVPFGEFLPFQEWLEYLGLEQLTRVAGGFESGSAPRAMKIGSLRFQPLICYEIIFPSALSGSEDRPSFILNVTNDGWFGDSPGPRQHLRQAQLRAVEEGLPVIRAANTGISAVIDPYGHLVASLALEIRGVLDSRLPAAIEPTPVRRWGHLVHAGALFLFGLIALPRYRP